MLKIETFSEQMENLNRQRDVILDKMKSQLAKELEVACETVKTLESVGVKNIFQDPRFSEFVTLFNVQPTTTPQTTKSTRVKSDEARLQVLEILSTNINNGLTRKQIHAKLPSIANKTLDIICYTRGITKFGFKIDLIDHPENGKGFIKVKA